MSDEPTPISADTPIDQLPAGSYILSNGWNLHLGEAARSRSLGMNSMSAWRHAVFSVQHEEEPSSEGFDCFIKAVPNETYVGHPLLYDDEQLQSLDMLSPLKTSENPDLEALLLTHEFISQLSSTLQKAKTAPAKDTGSGELHKTADQSAQLQQLLARGQASRLSQLPRRDSATSAAVSEKAPEHRR